MGWVKGTVLVLVAVCLGWFGADSIHLRLTGDWAEGTVTSVQVYEKALRPDSNYEIISFPAGVNRDGSQRVAVVRQSVSSVGKVGEHRTVVYDPNNPSRYRVGSFPHFFEFVSFLCLASLFWVPGRMIYKRRQGRHKEPIPTGPSPVMQAYRRYQRRRRR
ncbi:DUF3592 domain-containing protein [Rhizocola hellebori]|uniref:DUF3592 domain-containing protein n=1 Tax=Rhizocola hellebori TaxID=1392758 RepID=UPI0019430F7C|nr:DUF3592 domain-containing protein [Rhizocola hellebori]